MTEELNSKSLQQARKARKLSIKEVAAFTKVAPESLIKIETGSKQPTFKQLAKLCELYNVELHSLFLESLPEIESTLPDFRKSNPSEADLSPKGLSRLWQVERRAKFTAQVYEALGTNGPKIEHLNRLTNKKTPEAAELRSAFDSWHSLVEKNLKITGNREEKFVKFLRLFLETHGCQTVFNTAPMDDYLGFFSFISNKTKIIFVNREVKNQKRKLFTLAHEFSHLILEIEGVSDPFTAKNETEKLCNSFAASFLAPEHEIIRIVKSASAAVINDVPRLVNLIAKETLLSRQSSALRLEELDIISARKRAEFFRHLSSLSRVVEPNSEISTAVPMGRQAAIGKKLSEIGVFSAYTAQIALKAKLIDAIDIERGLGVSENLQKDVLEWAERRFEAAST